MTQDELIGLIRANPVFSLATVEDGQPRVRLVALVEVTPTGLTFYTRRHKDMCRQMQVNPHVELCLWASKERIQLRLRGQVEFLDTDEARQELLQKAPRAQMWVEKEGLQVLMPCRISRASLKLLDLSGKNPAEDVANFFGAGEAQGR